MDVQSTRRQRLGYALYGVAILALLYLPLIAITFASFSRKRYVRFPITKYTTRWYEKAFDSLTISDLFWTSLTIALAVTAICVVVGFFGALAYARYPWRGRKTFQKFILLPIFFPQTVLGLSFLLWVNFLGIIPTWQTAIAAHLVWIAPIATLIMAIQAYSFDPALEEAARDMGASHWQVLTEITLPLLLPGVISAGLFSFLLSWGNFPLSLFTTGADLTLPEWLYAKMVSGYSPLVPAVGTLTVLGVIAIITVAITVRWLYRRGHGTA
ncbi:MAG: ABC transporter permease [Alphaproteobacteria bacterium]